MTYETNRPSDISQRMGELTNSLRSVTDTMDDLTLTVEKDHALNSEIGIAIPLESIPGSEAFVAFLQEPFQRALSLYQAMRSPELSEMPIYYPRVSVVDDATAQYTCGENLIARNPFFNGIFISASKMHDVLSQVKFGKDLTKLKADIEGHALSYLWRVNLDDARHRENYFFVCHGSFWLNRTQIWRFWVNSPQKLRNLDTVFMGLLF